MAIEEHLKYLRTGVERWIAWREANLDVLPDLSEANLPFATFSNADLSGANLSNADLSFATLSNADLSGANLSNADLSGANLSGANLPSANLNRANLSGANLSGANLNRTNLDGANLSNTDLSRISGLDLNEIIREKVDLSLDVVIALPQQDIDLLALRRLELAIDMLINAAGYQIIESSDPVIGSWLRKLLFWVETKTPQSSFQAIKDALIAEWTGSAMAKPISDLTEATKTLIESLEPFDDAAIRLGQLLAIKITRDGKPMLRVDTLSSALARRLADDPKLLLNTHELWAEMDKQETNNPKVEILEEPSE